MKTYTLPDAGPIVASEADFTDHVGEALHAGAELVVLPVDRLSPDFFRLSSGLAGTILQKCTNYRLKVAVVGDISAYLAKSGPLRDFVHESNKRGDVRFITNMADL